MKFSLSDVFLQVKSQMPPLQKCCGNRFRCTGSDSSIGYITGSGWLL